MTYEGATTQEWPWEPGKRMKPQIVAPHGDESTQDLYSRVPKLANGFVMRNHELHKENLR
jgi:hypothetical protein